MRRLPLTVRRFGTQLLGSVALRIRSGPNAGYRWSLVSSGRGYGAGTFEADRVNAILALLREGEQFWDIGAHKGYVSLAAARAIGRTGSVFALEPSAVNRALLERHLRWNDAANIRVLPFAASDADGEERFGGSGSSITFQLGHGDDTVQTRTIRSLIEQDGLEAPTVLKIDAEGSEARILRGGLAYLSPHMLVWISVHSRALYDECRALLHDRAFRLYESARMAERTSGAVSAWGGDKELLAVGSARAVTDAELRALRLFHAD